MCLVHEVNAGITVPLFGFAVTLTLTPSFLTVAVAAGKYFLADGYHRAYGLLAAGMCRPTGSLGDQAPVLSD